MLGLKHVDHVGIRISDKVRSIAFYRKLGFTFISDKGFENGHPVILLHPSGLVFNLLGPATHKAGENILMDDKTEKYPGYTHVAFKLESHEDAVELMEREQIKITGKHSFRGMETIFIRDPDRNVLELVAPGPSVVEQVSVNG